MLTVDLEGLFVQWKLRCLRQPAAAPNLPGDEAGKVLVALQLEGAKCFAHRLSPARPRDRPGSYAIEHRGLRAGTGEQAERLIDAEVAKPQRSAPRRTRGDDAGQPARVA
jgi:hypothetical protein